MTERRFKPEEHFRNLKGQMYLDVKWRVVWFREEHVDGFIETELVHADWDAGLAVFKARAGWTTREGRGVVATGYGSETRKDFGDFAEKAETKAVGRALAMLGYGTAQAIELDEGERIVDSPVERGGQRRADLTVVRVPTDLETLKKQVAALLEADPEGAAKIPKAVGAMDLTELTKTYEWLTRRVQARS